MDPTIYLLAFGFGFGSLVSKVAGYNYIDFVGTGIVATTVLFSGVQLVRHVVFGRESFADVGHLAFLTVFAVVSWRLAIRFLERKLILRGAPQSAAATAPANLSTSSSVVSHEHIHRASLRRSSQT